MQADPHNAGKQCELVGSEMCNVTATRSQALNGAHQPSSGVRISARCWLWHGTPGSNHQLRQ